ncbi:ABC transporter ATP-binding protein [Neisseria dumasiana]|uniref:ABC transporter ATP-binding protein n=1 Tax=Neisseria dumasiana TaxID=1931275 RepID=UPI000A18AF01|nr:ABC transporter ATP-binding protein [Neisseria dumasiana]OSI14846.1 ferrichrome ABC transporter ATP-binding protein [Neisseria dumasiana]
MTNYSFTIKQLKVTAKTKVLLEIEELNLPHGCHTAIIGPNGAGKSTLLKSLIRQTGQGTVNLFGKAVAPQLKQGSVAWVAQHGQYQMPLTVREYIELGRNSGSTWPFQTASKPSEQAEALLAHFDLQELAEKRIQTLSGGEQQRANIIRALLQNAPILLLDEPCNHLDIRHQHSLMNYLGGNRQHFSAVMVLHDLNLAARYAQHVILMNQGKVVAAGAPEQVMQPELLAEVYQWPIERVCDEKGVYFRI